MTHTLNVIGTCFAILANAVLLTGFPLYVRKVHIRARGTYAGRHRAPELGSTMATLDTTPTLATLRARAQTERVAAAIERRALAWNANDPVELARYDQGAGSPTYLDLSPGALARDGKARSTALDDERVVTTGEMFALFGAPLVVDDWNAEPLPVGAP